MTAPHGTLARYRAGCHDACCRRANALRSNLRRLGKTDRYIDGTGTRRRLQALRRIGWRNSDIAAAAGLTKKSVDSMLTEVRSNAMVYTSTAARIRTAYDQLCMTVGPVPVITGRAAGWAVPLAWDDDTIDDPAAEPYRAPHWQPLTERNAVDQVVVERALAGDVVTANAKERAEIIRRWRRTGKPVTQLDDIQGWNVSRDRRSRAA